MNEKKKKAIIDVLKRCSKADDLNCNGCALVDDWGCFEKVAKNALALISELSADNEHLREMNDALANGFETVKADIEQKMVDKAVDKVVDKVVDTARKHAFLVIDNQYISIAELEQIAKGELT